MKVQSPENSTAALCCLVLMGNLSNVPVILASYCRHSLVGICFICFHSHWFVQMQEDRSRDWTLQEVITEQITCNILHRTHQTYVTCNMSHTVIYICVIHYQEPYTQCMQYLIQVSYIYPIYNILQRIHYIHVEKSKNACLHTHLAR